jgi:MoxR-like ATPase
MEKGGILKDNYVNKGGVSMEQSMVLTNAQRIISQVRRVVVGKDNVLLWVLAAILAKGHILLEDIPGVGKTTMALSFCRTLGLSYNRVQFTPDVLPSDVTGFSVMNQATGTFAYQPGAVLCNLFLADELNRATSRTQSALLEAMEEGQVTVDGISHPLPKPFVVIATQNPTGAAGTQLLPDSQMDRFMVRLSLGYPNPKDEVAMVLNRQGQDPLKQLSQLLNPEDLVAMQEAVAATHVHTDVVRYIVSLVSATRNDPLIARGASPRATLAVTAMAKAVAQLRGRDFVIPKDVQEVFILTVAHRLLLSDKAESQGITPRQALKQILDSVEAPKLR